MSVSARTVVLFDMDSTLLYQETLGRVRSVHRTPAPADIPILVKDIHPPPDVVMSYTTFTSVIYRRPHVEEAVLLARKLYGAENIHVYSASPTAEQTLLAAGIRELFHSVFDARYLQWISYGESSRIQVKSLPFLRDLLNLSYKDTLFLVDDIPVLSGIWTGGLPRTFIIPIPPYSVSFSVRGDLPTNVLTRPYDTALLECVAAIQ